MKYVKLSTPVTNLAFKCKYLGKILDMWVMQISLVYKMGLSTKYSISKVNNIFERDGGQDLSSAQTINHTMELWQQTNYKPVAQLQGRSFWHSMVGDRCKQV